MRTISIITAASIVSLYFLVLLTCNQPTDPFDVSQAKVSLILKSSDGQTSTTSITDTVGNSDTIGVIIYLTQHFDSTTIIVNTGTTIEYAFMCGKRSRQIDTVYYPVTFSSSGDRTVIATGYLRSNLLNREAKGTIKIVDRPQANRKPELAISGTRTVVAGETVVLSITAQDPDPGQTVTIEAAKLPDGATFAADTFRWATTLAEVGTDTAVFIASDNGSPVMTDTNIVVITVSATPVNRPPEWNPQTVPLAGQIGSTITLSLADKCTDPDGDILTYSLIPGAPDNDTLIDSTWSFTPAAGDTGAFEITIIARDPSSASDTLTIELSIEVDDNTSPTMKRITPSRDSLAVSSSSFQVTISCIDESGIALVKCEKGADTFTVTRSEDTLYSATVTGLSASAWNTIRFIAIDSAPAANSCTLSVYLKYDATLPDNVPPVITLVSPAADTVIGVDSCIIRVTCTDDSGVAVVSLNVGSDTVRTVKGTGDEYSGTMKSLAAGQYSTVTITAVDASAARNSASKSVRIKYDGDASGPTITKVTPANDSVTTNSSSYSVTLQCADASGVRSVNGAMGTSNFTGTRGSADNWTIAITGLTVNVFNTVIFTATDSSLRANTTKDTLYIKYDPTIGDNIPPTVYFTNPVKDTVIGVDSFVVSAICRDQSGVASLTGLRDATPFTMNKSATVDSIWTGMVKGLPAGAYATIKLIATDASTAGNRDSVSIRIKFDNDISGPAITRVTPANDSVATNSSSYTVTLQCTDASGVRSVNGIMGTSNLTGTRGSGDNWTIAVSGLTVNVYNMVVFTATDSSLRANTARDTVYIKYDPTMDDVDGPTIKQISGPASGSVIKDPVIAIIDSIVDPSKLDSVYWTLNGVWAGALTAVSGSPNGFQLRDTLTVFHDNRIVVHAIDSSTQRNRDSAVITLDYNTAPSIGDTGISTNKNTNKTITLVASSPDGDPVTWTRISDPAHGTVSGTLPAMTYAPANNYVGTDSFSVRVADGVWSDTGRVTITVNTMNYPPVMKDSAVATSKNIAVSFNLSGTDPDGDAVSGWEIINQGSHGTAVTTSPANRVTYTPSNNFTGKDTLSFRASDGSLFDTGFIWITVNSANYPPVVKDSTITINEDTPVTFNLSGTDPDGDALSGWAILKQGSNGTAALATSPANRVTYTPSNNFAGKDTFSFRAGDGSLYDTGFIWITINAVNDPPSISRNLGLTVNEGATGTVSTSYLNFSDPDNPTSDIIITVTVLPKNGQLTLSGTPIAVSGTIPYDELSAGNFRYAHNGSETVADSFSFSVSDGQAAQTGKFKFTISPVNDAPTLTLTNGSMLTAIGIGNYYRDTVTVSDPEGAYSSMSVTMAPSDAGFTYNVSNGIIAINWCIDFNRYSINQAVPCTLKVVDGTHTVTTRWTTTIGKHVWTKILTSAQVDAYMCTGTNGFAAHDSFKIYTGQDNGTAIGDIYCWTGSGTSWTRSTVASALNHGGMFLQQMICNNTRLLVAGALSPVFNTFNTTTNTPSMTITLFSGWWKNVFLSDGSSYFYTVYSKQNADSNYLYQNGDKVYSQYSGVDFYHGVSSPNHTFITTSYTSNGGTTYGRIGRLTNPLPNTASYVETPYIYNTNDIKIYTDKNNADTIYTFGSQTNPVRRIVNFSTSTTPKIDTVTTSPAIDENIISGGIAEMYSGSVGWYFSGGKLYFTRNGFASATLEDIEAGFTPSVVVISGDKKAIFAVGTDKAVYRY